HDGAVVESETETPGRIAPGESVTIPVDPPVASQGETHLRVTPFSTNGYSWSPPGRTLGRYTFTVATRMARRPATSSGRLRCEKEHTALQLHNDDVEISFDRVTGDLLQWRVAGVDRLAAPVRLGFWTPLIDNYQQEAEELWFPRFLE